MRERRQGAARPCQGRPGGFDPRLPLYDVEIRWSTRSAKPRGGVQLAPTSPGEGATSAGACARAWRPHLGLLSLGPPVRLGTRALFSPSGRIPARPSEGRCPCSTHGGEARMIMLRRKAGCGRPLLPAGGSGADATNVGCESSILSREAAGMEQKWLAVLISRTPPGAIPGPATAARSSDPAGPINRRERARLPPLRPEATWREQLSHMEQRGVRFACLGLRRDSLRERRRLVAAAV